MEREALEDSIAAFREGEERLAWAKLIKNKFRQNSQVRKSERHLFELSEKIIDMANCRALLYAALLPPSLRRTFKPLDLDDSSDPDDKASRKALNSLVEPYWNADDETKKLLEQVSDDPEKNARAILDQLPNEIVRPFLWNIRIRDNWTPPLRRSKLLE